MIQQVQKLTQLWFSSVWLLSLFYHCFSPSSAVRKRAVTMIRCGRSFAVIQGVRRGDCRRESLLRESQKGLRQLRFTDHAVPDEGLEWRATAYLRAAAYNPIGVTGRALGWHATIPDSHQIPGEGGMIEKRDGRITYYGGGLAQVRPPPNQCN